MIGLWLFALMALCDAYGSMTCLLSANLRWGKESCKRLAGYLACEENSNKLSGEIFLQYPENPVLRSKI